MQRIAMLAVLAGVAASSTATADDLSYVDLAGRLTDLEYLATLPDKGDTCAQWSSYDRRSRYEDGKYLDWGANGDGTGCIRAEGGRIVMAEMKGPGCIWRIWSALAQAGHVKVYLDGAETPAIDLPFDGYFNCKHAPFDCESLVYTAGRGRNNYVPIPYAKSCRIVAEKGWGRYFQFVYETFPKGTKVPTFSMDLSAEETKALAAADKALTDGLGRDPAGPRDGEKTLTRTVTVGGGESAVVADLDGPRAITAIRVDNTFGDGSETVVPALRELAVRITWDGAAEPAVWTPLGDLFGTAPGVNLYKSLPLGMTEKEFYCLWYMPFATSARVELANGGKEARRVTFSITHAPPARPMKELGRFHAKWHRDAFLPQDAARRAIDWTLLTTRGRGRFCGVMLHVWNPRGGWWGEGDEKFFVDGENFPSTIGTGSEDYFGYAWCTPEIFHHAYHNQTIASGNKGHVSVNRWHVGDNIPFQRSFEGAIEKYYPNAKPTLYAAISYWYQAPGGEDPYGPVPVDERTGYYVAPKIPRVKGALEGERLKILSKTAGNARPQDMAHYGPGWSGESQLWWTGAHPGDRLVLEVPVEKAGKYKLVVNLTKAIDYGIHQLALDGRKLGDPIDLFNDGVVPTGPVDLGTHELAAGKHKLTVEITGANPKAQKAYMFGLDYVQLVPAD
ncbi:MAG: DUF2961 domain-containing protein [Planctomycetota bacterium]|nr:DUF2961 domain-containing protein [Planctomycetota bacterium]